MTIIRSGNDVYIPFKYRPGFFHVTVDGTFRRESQVFSFQPRNEQNQNSGPMVHIAVPVLQRLIDVAPEGTERRTFQIRQQDALHVMSNNGVEKPHLDRLTQEYLEHPGILVDWSDGTSTIIDGNHRYVKRWLMGMREMDFWVVSELQARIAMIDFPDELAPAEVRR